MSIHHRFVPTFVAAVIVSSVVLTTGCRSAGEKTAGGEEVSRALAKQWQADVAGASKDDPITHVYVRDKQIFTYSKSHRVTIVDRGNGRIQNVYSLRSHRMEVFPPVLLTDNIVYPTSDHLEVYDLKGNHVRDVSLGVAIRSGGAASGKLMYLGADYGNGGRLLQIDLSHVYKPIRWELMTFGGISAAPAVFQSTIFCGGEDGNVYAVSEDRSGIWPMEGGVFKTGGRILADLRADDFGVYVASTDTKLYCLLRGNGKIRWQYFAGIGLTDPPEVTSDFVYQPVSGQGVVAIPKTEGPYNRTAKWNVADATQFLAEDDHNAYLARNDRRIVAIDKASGQTKFTSTDTFAAFGTNTKDGILYLVTEQGQLIAAKPDIKAGITSGPVAEMKISVPETVASAR